MFGFLKKGEAAEEKQASWTDRLKAGLAKTRSALNTPLGELFSRGRIDDELLARHGPVVTSAQVAAVLPQQPAQSVRQRASSRALIVPVAGRGGLGCLRFAR